VLRRWSAEYINANFVRGPNGDPKHYICTQGPLMETVPAFWRMVWEERPLAIVMITKLVENAKPKCAPYVTHASILANT